MGAAPVAHGEASVGVVESTIWWTVVVAVAMIAVGVCSEGRLKHWLLILMGVVPRQDATGPFGEIPRTEREWALLGRLGGLDDHRSVAPPPEVRD